MELTETRELQAFRKECREWLTEHMPATPLPPGETPDGFGANLRWERELGQAGWAAVSWPVEYGGRDASVWEWLIFEEEYFGLGLPQRVTQNGMTLLGPSLLAFGTAGQKARLLPRIALAQDIWAQGWSEPSSGSDLASLTSRAERDDDAGGWRLYGQKCWSTRAAFSTHLFGLFRTNPKLERHRGLTYFLVSLEQDGVDVRPVNKLDGTVGFADIFFDGAFVSDDDVLGPVDEGWRIAMSTTSSERGLSLRSPGRFSATAARLIELYHEVSRSDPQRADGLRDEVTKCWIDTEAYRLATIWNVTKMLDGETIGPEASLTKIFWSEFDIKIHETARELLGSAAHLDDKWSRGYQFALSGPIYAGTNEIQRDIIAERLLGLPRGR